MKKFIIIFLLILFAVIISGCSGKTEINETVKNEMRTAAKGFMSELKNILVPNLKNGGPVKAIAVCADTAQLLTKNYTEKTKLEIKRVSLKARNIKNQPDAFEKGILIKFDKMKVKNELVPETEVFETTEIKGEKVIRYMKPIITQTVCLNCHGDDNQINPEVIKLLNEKYPNDLARNYKEGDVRGAISIVKLLNN